MPSMRGGEQAVTTDPGPVPTLDALATDPSKAANLTGPAVAALLARVAAVCGTLAARAVTLTHQTEASSGPDEEDRLLTVEQAAERLAVSRDWIYRRASTLPFAVRLDGSALRFSAQGIARHIRQRRTRA
jgi:predicted DNA-binding transcriptional regulator AlpA